MTGLTATPTCSLSCQQADARFQQTWANFLLGNVNTFSQTSLDLTPNLKSNQAEFYVQDGWKVRRNLAVDIGLRYSLFRQPHDDNGLLTTFDPSLYNPARAPVISATSGLITSLAGTYDPLNGVIIAGTPGAKFGDKAARESNFSLGPRIGFVWDPRGDGKTAIRGGYGIAFDSGLVGILEQNIFANPPFTASVSISNTRLENPAVATPTLSANPTVLRATNPDMKIPYSQSFSLDVQRELPWKTILAVGYYGNKGTHLIGIQDINQPPPGLLQIVNGMRVVSPTSPHINAVRPFLGYGPINSIQSDFTSNYHSMQVSARKRFSGAGSISLSYTWSHGLTTAQTDRSSSPQNHYNLKGEYGASQLDRRHIFNMNYIYELPWMKGQNGLVGHLLGGWQVSGILYIYSGLPLTVTTSGLDPGGQGYDILASSASGRPDLVGNPNGPRGTDFQSDPRWLNTAAFAPVCPPTGACTSRPGTSGRGVVYGPGFWRTDFSVFKNIRITEQVRFQFRAEAFNLFNHTNPSTVNTTQTTTGTFGRISGYRDPREMQFGFKLSF